MMYLPQVLKSLTSRRKSQIAIEYAYRLRHKSPATSVFWINANNAARFEQSYRSIATAANIRGIKDRKVDVLNLVFQWLGNGESGDWLLILDNADDADIFFPPFTAPATQTDAAIFKPSCLSRFLPQTGTGSILITSRDEGTAFRLSGGQKQVLRVGVMSEDDTIALINNRLPEDSSDGYAKKGLVIELDLVPLAITQASAYIAIQSPRMTIAKYLEKLRHDEKIQIQLLSKNEVDLRRDPGVPNSVIRTWQVSFLQIKDQNPAAADLLSCMCMLDRQGIPEFLFCEDGDQSLEFEEAIGTLTRFSFVREEKGKRAFAMHRLVQLATRKWIESHGEMQRIQEEALRLVWRRYPYGEYENWTKCQALEPHAQIVLSYIYASEDCKLQQSRILHNGARYAFEQGSFKIAEEKAQQAVEIKNSCLDPDDQDTLDSLKILASSFLKQGRSTEAEKLEIQVLEVRKQVLGVEHPDTLDAMNSLAVTYGVQRRLTEAEGLNVQVLEKRKRVLGVEHPDTLSSMNNLATTYFDQKRWTEAEELYVQVIQTSKRVLGVEHPDILISMNNLARTYYEQKRWTEAEKLNVQVLQTRKRVLGVEHPYTLKSMKNMAAIYHEQKRWTEAEELDVQVLQTRKRVLGVEHPDTLIDINNLATTYIGQKRWTEAEELDIQVLQTRKRMLGVEHLDTLVSMYNLARTIYHLPDRQQETIALMEEVVELREKSLGADHPDTIDAINTLKKWTDNREQI